MMLHLANSTEHKCCCCNFIAASKMVRNRIPNNLNVFSRTRPIYSDRVPFYYLLKISPEFCKRMTVVCPFRLQWSSVLHRSTGGNYFGISRTSLHEWTWKIDTRQALSSHEPLRLTPQTPDVSLLRSLSAKARQKGRGDSGRVRAHHSHTTLQAGFSVATLRGKETGGMLEERGGECSNPHPHTKNRRCFLMQPLSMEQGGKLEDKVGRVRTPHPQPYSAEPARQVSVLFP